MDLLSGAVDIKLFADDIKIYLKITDVSALPSFQKSIDDIAVILVYDASCSLYKLAINKCQHIHISLFRSSVALPHFWLHSNI